MDRNPAPWWIGIFAAVAALLLVLQPAAGRQAEELVGSLLAPVSLQLSGAVASVSGFWNTIQSIGSLQSTVSQQKEEIERLNFELVRMRELELENEDLRKLNGFRYGRPKMELLPVRMLGTDSTGIVNTIIVDKGSEDGLTEDMAVITWQGLAGRVIEVKSNTASVLLLSDVSSSVAAKVQNPDVQGPGSGERPERGRPGDEAHTPAGDRAAGRPGHHRRGGRAAARGAAHRPGGAGAEAEHRDVPGGHPGAGRGYQQAGAAVCRAGLPPKRLTGRLCRPPHHCG